ncbi:PAS domain S-box protein [Metabacillus fastidiosus]|uniref:PAS domain S-box protein n=1 Tax=Metabacillus fastidiosus TaxID=1458 RepID=UPI002DBD4E35|nr:PAS domain S-box protein [Metabacillus fastidiosus]MEC2078260.1 PAS domain S-box protein [Metabacillus fastidiosus]
MKSYIEKNNDSYTEGQPLDLKKKKPSHDETNKMEKVKILMVDDRRENLLALEAVLNSPDYHLISANSGEEALRYVLHHDFAVILLDVQMPGLNGFETAKLIKKRKKYTHIPIIFITAINQAKEHVLRGYSVGAVDYIVKPFLPETLRLKVREFVKIYQENENAKLESERRRKEELKEVNAKLSLTNRDLRKNKELARVVGETLLDTIITFDCEGFILSVNPAVKEMFGYSMDELIGEHISSLLINNNQLAVDRLTDLPSKVAVECMAKGKYDHHFPVDIQIGSTSIENEKIFVCSIRDITERKKIEHERKNQYELLERLVEERTQTLQLTNEKLVAEMKEKEEISADLQLSQELFYKIFESSPCLLTIQKLENGEYIDVNASWLNNTLYSYEDVKNKAFPILHYVSKFDTGIEHNLTEISIHNEKIQYETKDKEVRDGLLSTEIIDVRGEKCILSVITDLTERVRLEHEIQRLDRLNLIGEMAAGIAHEIRNPMTTVRGFLELSKSSPEHLSKQYIDLMLGELKRANSIISEFLNLARNKMTHKVQQQLNTIVTNIFPLIQAEAVLSNKSVILELGECPEIEVDEKEITQVILNLSLNGLEAMDSGGKLTIKTYSKNGMTVLEIRDEGSGIDAEVLEKVGTPFFTTKEEGTGLGLAICYSVAERHKAVIDLETSEEGTTFFIRFNEDISAR